MDHEEPGREEVDSCIHLTFIPPIFIRVPERVITSCILNPDNRAPEGDWPGIKLSVGPLKPTTHRFGAPNRNGKWGGADDTHEEQRQPLRLQLLTAVRLGLRVSTARALRQPEVLSKFHCVAVKHCGHGRPFPMTVDCGNLGAKVSQHQM